MRPDDPALGPTSIRVGCANFEAVPRDKAATLDKLADVVAEAARRGCDLVVFPELAINTWGCVWVDLTEIGPDPFPGDVMRQRGELKLWLAARFRCYSFESRCHDWLFFSLHRRPYPPFAWSSCCLRTIRASLTASPCSRLSRPQSTISQSDFRHVIRSSLHC